MLTTACSGGGVGPVKHYSVSGFVLDVNGNGISGLTVTAVYDGDMVTEVTDADGAYEGRYAKVFIIDIRGHWNHSDRPAVDFVYHFTDEIDIEPPILEQVTVITENGDEVSQLVSDVIEFELDSIPEFMVFDFNEIVYRNRGLLQEQEDNPLPEEYRYSVWWSYPSPHYYQRPPQSNQFRGRIWGLHPDLGTVILTEGEDYSKYENDAFTDQGFYFSDLLGNRWTELPLKKLR